MTDRIVRALVTGASSGLGVEFARQLADRGVSLVLVARDQERLVEVAAQLPVDVEVLPADLTEPEQLARVELRAGSTAEPIDLLVNNAGSGGFGAVQDLTADDHAAMISLNVTALVRLTRAALPQLLERDTGGVIQMGSVTGYQPNPYSATYGASKAFVRSFSEALHHELAGHGPHVLLVSPGSTRTAFHARAGAVGEPVPEQVQMDVDTVVAAALRAFANRRAVCVPGALNTALTAGAQLTPSAISGRLAGLVQRRFSERS